MAEPGLTRQLGLLHVVLYGLGVTVGAGIYALVGGTIALAGDFAPVAFVVAALVMLLPAACFAELTGRLPFAAAEAHFVQVGFRSEALFKLVGAGVAAVGIVSSAAIAHGAVVYLGQVIDLPVPVLLALVIGACGAVASAGIRSSIGIAGALTVIEVGGLVLIIGSGLWAGQDLVGQAARAVPLTLSGPVWSGIMAASLLAFFAFIGFEDIDSIAEETVDPQKTLARGIFLTLAITTLLYLGVVLTVLATVPAGQAGAGAAPLVATFTANTGLPAVILTVIASFATINGVIVQLIMAGRVVYGVSRQGAAPVWLGGLSPSGAPVRATVLATGTALVLALVFPIVRLAEWTSAITLVVFALVCVALARIRARGEAAPPGTFRVYPWVPVAGAVACAALLVAGLIAGA